MSTKVSPFMGGLGRDVTNKFEITDNATVVIGAEGSTGNLELGHDLVVGNSIVASGNVTIGSHADNVLAVTGNVTVSQDVIVSNSIFITEDIIISGDVNIGSHSDNTFTVTGIFDLGALS